MVPEWTVVVVAFQRAWALERLLRSLDVAADYSGIRPRVIVSIDGGVGPCVEVMRELESKLSPTPLLRDTRMGLREHVLACGDMTAELGQVVVLEEDLVAAPGLFTFVEHTLPYARSNSEVGAISLYDFQNNEFAKRPTCRNDVRDELFLAKTASSWGQVWWRETWSAFREWLASEYKPEKEEAYAVPGEVRRWKAASWKKLMNFYFADRGLYSLTPMRSRVLNLGERGEHHPGGGGPAFSAATASVLAPELPDAEMLARFDSFLEPELDREEGTVRGTGVALAEVELDSSGTKRARDLQRPYVCTSRRQPAERVLATFSGESGSALLALRAGIPGDGLALVRSDDFDEAGEEGTSTTLLRNLSGWQTTRIAMRVAARLLLVGIWSRFLRRIVSRR